MTESVETKVPSKEQLIAALQEQIDVKTVQAELQDLNTRLAQGRANELEAYAKIAHFSNNSPSKEDAVEHIVTQDDIDNHPGMTQQGIKVGDKIGIPKDDYEQFISKNIKQQPQDTQHQEVKAPERKLRAVQAD